MKNILFPITLILLAVRPLYAQTDSSGVQITFSGYAEPYYGYDLNQPADANRPGFVYAHHRHNEFNVNLAFLKATLSAPRLRGNLGLMAGTYANANLSAEPGTLKNVWEANAGVRLSKQHELWVDAGIFGSHIGFESAIGKDCWTLTRSIIADNSPYYEAGAKISYTSANGKWLLSALLLNGWQRIQRLPGNTAPSGGWQIQFKPSERVTLNSSSFIGTDKPDSIGLRRVFHNFYGIFQLTERLGLILGLDTGWEENPRAGEAANAWFGPVAIGRYAFSDRLALALRAEYYADEHGVIISPGGFKTLGLSANLDVQIHRNALWRIEGKWWNSQEAIFTKNKRPTSNNAVLTTALALWF